MANEIRDAFNEVYADGPVGSETQPQKSEIRSRIGGGIQTAVDGLDARVTAVEGAAGGLPARVTALEATSADHEVRIDNVESLIETGAKTPVAVSTLSETNIAIASGVVNGATIGGFVVATGQTVVLTGQSAPAENGAYIVAASGAASRSPLFDTSAELLGATFAVSNGTFQGTVYAVRNETAITIGTTAITITHAYGTPGNPTQAEVTAARQGYPTVADNLTAMKATAAAQAAPISSRTVGPVPITGSVGGTVITNDSVYFWPGSLSTVDEYLSILELGFGAVPGTTHIVIAHVEGDGTLSLVSEQTISVPAGPSSVISALAILKPAGSVMGVRRTGAGSWYYTAGAIPNGEVEWVTAAVPTSHTAKTIGAVNGPQWKATYSGDVAVKARAAFETANELVDVVGTELDVGWPDLVNTGSNTPANYSVILQTPAQADGFITEVDVGASASGAANIHVIQYNGDLTVNVISTTPVTLSNGVASIPLAIPIAAGQYPAISGGGYKFQNGVNPQGIPAWIKAGALSNGATVASSSQHRYEVRFTIETGLIAEASRALGGGAQNTGMNLLAGADPNGIVDATTILASAASAHPNPYVPPGSFAVTAIPASGDGFWGPGKPFVGGRRFFVPRRPSLQNLYDGFRAKMAEHIANNDVLCLIADSIGHWALASDGPKHWFNLVTRFANIGIADDEPGMTALRPSSTYVPTFYGVTVAGSVSTGTRGPLGESIILAAGASLAFTGAYEQVDVHYTQDAAQGSLAFAFNGGAAYKSVNCAGALVLDQYSGPSLTGQAASGNYTLTAVGGPVEITGLIRLGVKAAGSRPRLRTLRASHGSYTFSSFNAARLASAIAQCGYAGGKIVPILALGINDSFGTPPATISTTITTIINTLEAAAAPRIIVMPPTRPSSSWDSSYTGGRTYDAALGAIRQTYRSRNVLTIPIDGFDYINSGSYQEGLHFNDAGHDGNALRFIEYVAERG